MVNDPSAKLIKNVNKRSFNSVVNGMLKKGIRLLTTHEYMTGIFGLFLNKEVGKPIVVE